MGNNDKKKHKHRSRSRSPRRERWKGKKDRKRSSSSSSSDSDSSHSHHRHKSKHKHKSKDRRSRSRSPIKKKLSTEDKEHLKQERMQQKELLKATETAEEKRARRLAKKEAKRRKRHQEMGWDEEYMEYTNADNPFGDEHLLDTFVWNKKLEKEGKKTLTGQEVEKLQKQKMIENKIELEKVKKRRLEREREMEERDKDRERMQREKEAEYYREWEKQEDKFHFEQAKLRSKIRIEDGRAKPIDLLAKYISAEDDDLALEMHEPYTYLNGLTINDLEDLLEDIKVYIELEMGKNVDYWKDITIITEDELSKLRKIDPSRDYVGERRSGINSSVEDEVSSVFKGKTLEQLEMLEQSINKKLQGGEGVDVGYWESLLGQLRAHMARTRLRERHQEELRRKLFRLKQEQGIEESGTPLFPIIRATEEDAPQVKSELPSASTSAVAETKPAITSSSPTGEVSGAAEPEAQPGPSTSTQEEKGEEEAEEEDNAEPLITEEDLAEQSFEEYESGRYTPTLIQASELEIDAVVYDPEVDIKRLEYARRRVMSVGKAKDETESEFVKRAREGMNDDEAQFSVQVPLEKQALLWSDKYRPRKPRFFNRVHTGFEWNKYNQTHYDIDNPPPKIVQGYKFNIFYPDLIDKTKTPEYFLTPIEDNKDFATLRFHAGPPYEDIAFKIVNREWEYSYKRGFRCQFHNNIFQLWFHFKRYRYRR